MNTLIVNHYRVALWRVHHLSFEVWVCLDLAVLADVDKSSSTLHFVIRSLVVQVVVGRLHGVGTGRSVKVRWKDHILLIKIAIFNYN